MNSTDFDKLTLHILPWKNKDKLEKEKILYEIAEDIDEDQTYYFEKERIYLYVEKKEKIE